MHIINSYSIPNSSVSMSKFDYIPRSQVMFRILLEIKGYTIIGALSNHFVYCKCCVSLNDCVKVRITPRSTWQRALFRSNLVTLSLSMDLETCRKTSMKEHTIRDNLLRVFLLEPFKRDRLIHLFKVLLYIQLTSTKSFVVKQSLYY